MRWCGVQVQPSVERRFRRCVRWGAVGNHVAPPEGCGPWLSLVLAHGFDDLADACRR